MNLQKKKQAQKQRRKARILVKGTAETPRLSVFRSLRQISAQLIDDEAGATIVSASSGEIKAKGKNKSETAAEVGRKLAQKAKEMGVSQVVFDRGSAKYHGRIEALARGAREGGLKF